MINIVFTSLILVFFTVTCIDNIKNRTNIDGPFKSNNKIQQKTDTTKNTQQDLSEFEIIGGWIELSVNQQTVIDKLGKPENMGKDEYWEATGNYVQNWEYIKDGIYLGMESSGLNNSKTIQSILITSPCKLATSHGIVIGSTDKLVKEKYLNSIDPLNSNSKHIVVGSIYGGTVFTLDNGFVSKIFIGSLAE